MKKGVNNILTNTTAIKGDLLQILPSHLVNKHVDLENKQASAL